MPTWGWVFSLSFWLEFCVWVLVFSVARVKKKPALAIIPVSVFVTLPWPSLNNVPGKAQNMYLRKMLHIDNHCLPTVWFIKDGVALLTLCLRSALIADPIHTELYWIYEMKSSLYLIMMYGPWWFLHTWDWSKAKSLAVRTFISSESCLRWDLRSWESRRWRLLPSGPRLLANVFLAIWKTFWIGASPEIPPALITRIVQSISVITNDEKSK